MFNHKKTVALIGVPCDLGANLRGTNLGPHALRTLHIASRIGELGYDIIDLGDLAVPSRDNLKHHQKNNYLVPITELCYELKAKVNDAVSQGLLPIVLGGDHSLAIGSVSGVLSSLQAHNKTLGVIWIDAHGDFNTPQSSPTGNIHGMPLATLLGHGHELLTNLVYGEATISPKHVALIGLRDIDKEEKDRLKKSGILCFTMHDIDKIGVHEIMKRTIEKIATDVDALHLSFDLDSLDPSVIPGVSTPVAGGLSFREARLLLELLHQTRLLVSMDFVELNPCHDQYNRSATLCVSLIESALGKVLL